jgi:hypothetical protein
LLATSRAPRFCRKSRKAMDAGAMVASKERFNGDEAAAV